MYRGKTFTNNIDATTFNTIKLSIGEARLTVTRLTPAFSTANNLHTKGKLIKNIESIKNSAMDDFFISTIEATEESILNALVAAETMVGINNKEVPCLPISEMQKLLKQYNRLVI